MGSGGQYEDDVCGDAGQHGESVQELTRGKTPEQLKQMQLIMQVCYVVQGSGFRVQGSVVGVWRE